VVVSTRDRAEMLATSLTSIRAALRDGDELVVVDSASTDPAVREIALAHGARYVRCAQPGLARARNAGWRAAAHETILFVDDDVRVSPDWAGAFAGAFDAYPEIAFATGRVAAPPGQEGLERPVALQDDDDPATLDRTSRGGLGSGASFAVLKDALALVGGFDELLGAGGLLRSAEDGDMFDRLLAAGKVGRYEPASVAWHDQWRRSKRDILRLEWRDGVGNGARLSKLLRTDRERARTTARDLLWDGCVLWIGRNIRRRYEFGVVTVVVRLVATLIGCGRAFFIPVRGGHFVARR
jgi:glycosyltransferase involved in cell wall biosynthesis